MTAAAQESVMAQAGTSKLEDHKSAESNTAECTVKSGLPALTTNTANADSTTQDEGENFSQKENSTSLNLTAPAEHEDWVRDEISPKPKTSRGANSANESVVADTAPEQKCTSSAERPKSSPKRSN